MSTSDRDILDGLHTLLGPDAGFILLVQDRAGAATIRCVATMPVHEVGQILRRASGEIADGNTLYERRMRWKDKPR